MLYRTACFLSLQMLVLSTVLAQDATPQITISKETTWITSRLRADGRVDYTESLRQLLHEGVTAENNSVVMFRRALGYQGLKPEIADEFFRQLGMEVLPKDGNYLIGFYAFTKSLDLSELPGTGSNRFERTRLVDRQQSQANSRPWTREEFPLIARWIDANEIPLGFVLQGSTRSRFFVPMLPADKFMAPSLLDSWEYFREFVQLLNAHAMLKLGEGDPDTAWQDVAACHRLARLYAQGPTQIAVLVAASTESIACRCDDQIASHSSVNSARCRTYLAELLTIGPIEERPVKFRIGDRFNCLEFIHYFALLDKDKRAKPLPWLFFADDGDEKSASAFFRQAVERELIDWNDILKQSNTWSDRFAAVTLLPTRAERQSELVRLETELKDAANHAMNLCRTTKPESKAVVTEIIGRLLLVDMYLPSEALDVGDRCVMRTQLSYCGFALAAWKADHGSYPDEMTRLVPDYLQAIPIDEFTGQALIYRKTRDRYCLYSVGPNLKDDGGFTAFDTNEADDIAVRTPDEDERIQAIIRERRGQK